MKTAIALLFLLLNAGHLFASGEPEPFASSEAEQVPSSEAKKDDIEKLNALIEVVEADIIAGLEESSSDLQAIAEEEKKVDHFNGKAGNIVDSIKVKTVDPSLQRNAIIRIRRQGKKLETEIDAITTSVKQLKTFSEVFKNNTTDLSLDNISTPIDLVSPIKTSSQAITIASCFSFLHMCITDGKLFFMEDEIEIKSHDDLIFLRKNKIRYKKILWDIGNNPTHDDLIGAVDLTFGMSFSRLIKAGVLPATLTQLNFGNWFNQPIGHGVLPAFLTNLTFGVFFEQPIEPNVLPASLTHLTLYRFYKNRNPVIVPAGCSIVREYF